MFENFEGLFMDRVLITGAAGFLGFHIAKSLVLSGVSVFCCDSFVETASIELKKARAKILELMGVKIEVLDVTRQNDFTHFLQETNPTHILHLANVFQNRGVWSERVVFDQQVDLFWAVLDPLAALSGNKKLVFASSAEVYDSKLNSACKERDATFDHQSLKASILVTCESLASTFYALHGVESMGMRFFDVYGPWGNSTDMKYHAYTQSLLQEDLPELSSEQMNQALDLVYIDDAVDGIWTALQNVQGARVMNIGAGRVYSPGEILRTFSEAVLKMPFQEQSLQASDQVSQQGFSYAPGIFADLTFANSLGYRPQTSLRRGVELFVGWYVSRGKDFVKPARSVGQTLLSK